MSENVEDGNGWHERAVEKWNRRAQPEQPDVVHGRWLRTGDYVTTAYGSLNICECSVCEASVTIDDYDSFCPSCGAKMDGGERDAAN